MKERKKEKQNRNSPRIYSRHLIHLLYRWLSAFFSCSLSSSISCCVADEKEEKRVINKFSA